MTDPGPTLLITRPEPSGAAFALSVIEALGHAVPTVLSPMMRIAPVDAAWPVPGPEGIILTSVHGAEAARRIGAPAGLTAWCVGTRTAEAARSAGLSPISAGGDAGQLTDMILSRRPAGPLLHLRGEHVTGTIAQTLTAAGVPCSEVIAYRQDALPLTRAARRLLAGPDAVVIPLFSPRSVSILAKQGPYDAPIDVVAISPAVAEAAQTLTPRRLWQAGSATASAMCAATCDAIAAK